MYYSLLIISPPGSGKSMIAKRPPHDSAADDLAEAIETTKIHSICGLLNGSHQFAFATGYSVFIDPSASSEPISGARSAALQRVPDQVRLIINRHMDDYQPVVCHSACSGTPCRLFAKGINSRPVYNTMPRIHFFPTSPVKARNPAVSFGFSVAAAFTSRPTIRPALSHRVFGALDWASEKHSVIVAENQSWYKN